MAPDTARTILTSLAQRSTKPPGDFATRFREWSAAAERGDGESIARIVREMHPLYVARELSFGERTLFAKAKALLAAQLGPALGQSEPDTLAAIDRALG